MLFPHALQRLEYTVYIALDFGTDLAKRGLPPFAQKSVQRFVVEKCTFFKAQNIPFRTCITRREHDRDVL